MARCPLRPPSEVAQASDQRAAAALRAGPARRYGRGPERRGGARARRAVEGPPARASAVTPRLTGFRHWCGISRHPRDLALAQKRLHLEAEPGSVARLAHDAAF